VLPPFIKETIIPRLQHFKKVIVDRGASQSEKDTAQTMYDKLMKRHKLTEDMLEGDDVVEETFFFESPYQYILLMTITEHFGLKVLSDDSFSVGRVKANKRIMEAVTKTYNRRWEKIDSWIVGMMIYYAHKVLPGELEYIKQQKEWNPYEGDEPDYEKKALPEPNPMFDYQDQETWDDVEELEDDFTEEQNDDDELDDIIDEHPPEEEQKPENPILKHKTLRKLYVQDDNVLEMVRKMKKSEEQSYSSMFGGFWG
jgi:hypothetical protein